MTDTVNTSLCIVVVTYRRNDLLQQLFESFAAMTVAPARIFVIDNDASETVCALCSDLQTRLAAGAARAPAVSWVPLETNTGGAGGFSRGMREAYDAGFQWIWLMDDDVKVFPDALERLVPWLTDEAEPEHGVLQCSKLNFTGEPFYWQYRYWPGLCMLNPFAKSGFQEGEHSKPMNTVCFEGGLFHRSVIARIGLPDARFFIHWDDTAYGYRASKETKPLLIDEVVMQRTRETSHLRVGTVRKLNAASDMMRYHTMRNRGYLARYAQLYGDYRSLSFACGTLLVFCQELLRLFLAGAGAGQKRAASIHELFRGMRDARAIVHDANWMPMPALEPVMAGGDIQGNAAQTAKAVQTSAAEQQDATARQERQEKAAQPANAAPTSEITQRREAVCHDGGAQ